MDVVRGQVSRFYDGGVPGVGGERAVPPDPDQGPRIVLERHAEQGAEEWAMLRRIAYRDRHLGELLVPDDPAGFRTDLTSVPWLFTWLVPITGAHLPPALLHDGLVHRAEGPPSYVSTEGHVVDRVEADRVFRDAMADTGTGLLRRWLVWAAVTTATILVGGTPRVRPWHRLAAVVTIVLIAWLGASATADLVDRAVPGLVELPWMGDRSWPAELFGGLAGAVVIPFVLGVTWGRFWRAGVIIGVLLAVLLHVTLALLVLSLLYRVAEEVAERIVPRAAGDHLV